MTITDSEWSRALDSPQRPAVIDVTRCSSQITLNEHVKPYSFFGARADDAGQSLRQRLLVTNDFDGRPRRFTGQTDWHIEWRACYESVGNGCRIGGVVSNVQVAYTLPRWADRDSAPTGLRDRWDRYIGGLTSHEKGHGAIALKVAGLMEAELVGLADGESCASISAQAQSIVEQVMQRGEQMQREYDRMTSHGSAQGAVFPF